MFSGRWPGKASSASAARFRDDLSSKLANVLQPSPASLPPEAQVEQLARLIHLIAQHRRFNRSASGVFADHTEIPAIARQFTRPAKSLATGGNKSSIASLLSVSAESAAFTAAVLNMMYQHYRTRYDLYVLLGFTEMERAAADAAMDDGEELKFFSWIFGQEIARMTKPQILKLGDDTNNRASVVLALRLRKDVKCKLKFYLDNKVQAFNEALSLQRCGVPE